MRFIPDSLKLRMKRKKWRKLNSHNKTTLSPITELSNISVGNETYGNLNVLNASENYWLRIGHYCSIAPGVTFIVCSDHPTDTISTYPFKVMCIGTQKYEAISKGDIVVEDDVWIAYGATIMSGVRIGQGAVVAAGAVVTKDVPPYAIVGGIPAKVIRYRFEPEIRENLLRIKYEKISPDLVRSHIDAFYKPLEMGEQLQWLLEAIEDVD